MPTWSSRMQAQAIEGPWAAGERILACIGPDASSPAVVRATKRLADLMDAPWLAMTVERPGGHLDDNARLRIDAAMTLAQSLGADTQTLTGNDVPGGGVALCQIRERHPDRHRSLAQRAVQRTVRPLLAA